MMDTTGLGLARKPYTSPTLTMVELVTNEAVFQNCKLSTRSSGPSNYNNRCQINFYGYPIACDQYLS